MKIRAKELKPGDVFIFNNKEQVAIDTVLGNSLWITNRQYYLTKDKWESGFIYGRTNSTIISINTDDIVNLIENIEQ